MCDCCELVPPEFPRNIELVTTDPSIMGGRTVEDVIVQQLMAVAESLVQDGVGLVGCQKCIHPLVKEYLREQVGRGARLEVVYCVAFFTGPLLQKESEKIECCLLTVAAEIL